MNSIDIQNSETYENKYSNGYGLQVPDGHIIRIYKSIIENELKITGGSLLDYGCGNGIHAEWINKNGAWNVYGVDISKIAINIAKSNPNLPSDNFHIIENYPNLVNLFEKQSFDLILCNQSLYYVDDPELEFLLDQFQVLLKPGGIFVATMLDIDGAYYDASEYVSGDSRRKVSLNHRLTEQTYISFKTKEQVLQDFSRFRKIHYGFYDIQIKEDEGHGKHHIYIGIAD